MSPSCIFMDKPSLLTYHYFECINRFNPSFLDRSRSPPPFFLLSYFDSLRSVDSQQLVYLLGFFSL